MNSKPSFSIQYGKKKEKVKTDILDKFIEDGKMEQVHVRDNRNIYKITKGSEAYIFKSITCPLDDKGSIKDIREEYDINVACSKLTKGVVKPLAFEQIADEVIGDFTMEILYEYFGENLLSLISKEDAKNVMEIMKSVALIMKDLENGNFCHYDLKPENILINNGEVKIIDFGSSRIFEKKFMLYKTTTTRDRTLVYSPPETLRSEKTHPAKLDVFCWGMTLYQLLGNKTISDLEKEHDLRKKPADYPKFLDIIKNLKIECDKDLRENAIELLLYVLSEDHQNRPRFTELCKYLNDHKKIEQLKSRRLFMEKTKKKEGYSKYRARLFNKLEEENKSIYEKVKSEFDSITTVPGKTSCDLHSLCIRDTGAKIIALALSESRNLVELNLGFNKIGFDGIEELVKGLKVYNTLKVLILGKAKQKKEQYEVYPEIRNPPEEEKISPTGSKVSGSLIVGGNIVNAVATGVSSLSATTASTVAVATLGAVVLGTAAAAIGVGYILYRLIKSRNQPKVEAPKPIIEIRYVDDPEFDKINDLGTIGTNAIADYLKDSKLTKIDLSYCNISLEAIDALVDAANACNPLMFISIKGNKDLKGKVFKFISGLECQY